MHDFRRDRSLTTEAQLLAARAEPVLSAMARAAAGLPFRPYDPAGAAGPAEPEPAPLNLSGRTPRSARRAAAYLLTAETMPDLEPDPEWYRELADDF